MGKLGVARPGGSWEFREALNGGGGGRGVKSYVIHRANAKVRSKELRLLVKGIIRKYLGLEGSHLEGYPEGSCLGGGENKL
jgi:hypothetical protein